MFRSCVGSDAALFDPFGELGCLFTALATDYQAGIAQQRSQAQRRAGGAARRKLGADLASLLWCTVLTGLRSRWSPQQIAGKLPRTNTAAIKAGQVLPTQPMSVSLETIYCAIYALPRIVPGRWQGDLIKGKMN